MLVDKPFDKIFGVNKMHSEWRRSTLFFFSFEKQVEEKYFNTYLQEQGGYLKLFNYCGIKFMSH